MNTVTQALLGATVGQCFSEKLGRRAAWWGAAAGVIPDLDVVVIPFMGRLGEFEFHRGPTHSFWFGPVVGAALGYATWRWYRAQQAKPETAAVEVPNPGAPGALRWWILLWFFALFTHPLLDICTPYGTMFLAPFSDLRLAVNAVAIIDPMYSVPLMLALLAGRVFPGNFRRQAGIALAALVLTTSYLFYGLWLNERAAERARADLASRGLAHFEVRAYPTMAQVFLRRAVARAGDEVRVAHFTMWRDTPIVWEAFENARGPQVEALMQTREGRVFSWFASHETAVHVAEHGGEYLVEIDDLRYGLPGTPQHGIWGVRAKVSRDGELLAEPELFDRPRIGDLGAMVAQLWRSTFALDAPRAH